VLRLTIQQCHQYKPDTDVVKAAKKACTSYLNQVCQCQVDWCLMTFIYVQFCDFSMFTFFHLLWLYLWLFRRSHIRSLLTYFCYGRCCLAILKKLFDWRIIQIW
jgi:hypothetical protein